MYHVKIFRLQRDLTDSQQFIDYTRCIILSEATNEGKSKSVAFNNKIQ